MLQGILGSIVLGLSAVVAIAGEPPKPLCGRVVDEKGDPLAGATVTAFEVVGDGWDGRHQLELASLVTEADGRFLFDAQTSEKCDLILATKAGKSVGGTYVRAMPSAEVELPLGAAAALDGIVVDDAGRPIAGVDIRPSFHEQDWGHLDGVLWTTTDAQGRFCFSNLPAAATLELEMSAPTYARALVEGPIRPGQDGLRFVLPREGRLEGMVVENETGKPLPHVRLSAMSGVPSGMHRAYAKTDESGRFLMTGLSGGKYQIEITGEVVDDVLLPPDWIVSTQTGRTEKVEVKAGETTSGVTVEVIEGGLLEIALAEAGSGRPVQSHEAIVWVSPEKDLRITHWASPSTNGKPAVRLAPGNYVVTGAIAKGCLYNRRSDPFRIEAGKTTRAVVEVDPVAPPSDDPNLSASARVAGIVCDPQGNPVPKASVQVLPLFGNSKSLQADDEGRFSIPASDVGMFFCFVWIRHPSKELVALGTAVLAKGEPEDQQTEQQLAAAGIAVLRAAPRTVTLRPPVVLSGTVRDPQGKPINNAVVTARIDASHVGRSDEFAATRTGPEGRYRLDLARFTITSYAVMARSPGYTDAETVLHPEDLLPGRKPTADLVMYPNDRTVRGIVQDEQGRPVPGAVITATRMGSHRYPGCVVSDIEGRFTLENLDNADTIYLFAHVPGRGWSDQGSTIRPGENEVKVRVGPCHWE